MKIKDIQLQLANRGYTPGPIDGVWGRRTQAAVRLFQERHGLETDGVCGPLTTQVLFQAAGVTAGPAPSAAPTLNDANLVWLQEARRLIGTREKPGIGNNPDIIDWASTLSLKDFDADEIPWCGLFVGHCISSTLDREPTPTNLLSARSWERFGIPTQPTPGAILVFWREARGSWKGHVGFYAGEDDEAYRVLGGNQSDCVSLAWIAKDRLVTARWPSTVPPTVVTRIDVNRQATLSWNEA